MGPTIRSSRLISAPVVAALTHPTHQGDTPTLSPTQIAARNLAGVSLAPSEREPCVLVADKGHHARQHFRVVEGE